MTASDLAMRLPGPRDLRRLSQALAVLDSVLSPSWEDRYYSFNARWTASEELASMRNGSGDEYSIVFSGDGVFIRGFDHESPMSPFRGDAPRVWPGVVDSVPEIFRRFVDEPAFSSQGLLAATVCIWRQSSDAQWSVGAINYPSGINDPDGSDKLFDILASRTAQAYQSYAHDYFEIELDLGPIQHVLNGRPLTDTVLRQLNPVVRADDIRGDLNEISYPLE